MLGPQTGVVDGQRFSFPTSAQYNPTRYGPQTTGVPQVSPTMPPFFGGNGGAANGSPGPTGAMEGVEGYGTAGNNATVTAIAAANPHNIKVSPVWWTVGALVGGILLLRAVHWRSLERGAAEISVGPGSAAASESV